MMRQLLIDIGNSRIKWAIYEDKKLIPAAARSHRGQALAGLLDTDFGNIESPDKVFISCVAGKTRREEINNWMNEHWQLQPHYLLSSRQAGGVVNAYHEPANLGSDRWAAMIAAFHDCGGPVCVVDAGTALTIDVVNENGIHQGGMILPGMYSTREILFSATDIPSASLNQSSTSINQLLGASTQECINLGMQHTIAALFTSLFTQLKQEFGIERCCMLTGGDAFELMSLLPVRAQLDEHLVLKGLAVLATNT